MNWLESKLWKVLESDNDSKLKDVLLDVEFWEGGTVEMNDDGEVWVSGDNGRKEVSNLLNV